MLKKLFIRCSMTLLAVLILFFSSAYSSLWAQESIKGPVDIEADSMTYDQVRDEYHAEGKVLITFSGGTLKADSVRFNKSTNTAVAEGHVILKSGDDVLEGDKVHFNVQTQTGVVYEGRMFVAKNHFYLTGSHIEKKGEATYQIKGASATTCDGENPDWLLTGRELNVTIDGYGILKHGSFRVKDIPVLYIPCLPFPAKTTRQTGFLLPYMSYSRDKDGLDVEIPFFWAVTKSMDATFYQRYIEKRGFKEGMEFRYAVGENTYGTFYGDFLNDRKQVVEDASAGVMRNWQSDQKRWSYYWNHETRFDPTFYVRADIGKVSDNWYFKDFSSHNYYLDHYTGERDNRFEKVPFWGDESLAALSSTARVFKAWDHYSLSLLGRYTDDFTKPSNSATLQTYPELTFTGVKQPVFDTPLYWGLDTSYNYYYRSEGQKGHLYDLEPVISLPLNLGRHVQLTPELGWKGTFWRREDPQAQGDLRRDDRNLMTAGISLNTELSRLYNVNGTSIDKIMHRIVPEVSYQYIAGSDQEGLPDFVATYDAKNALTYALTNTFTARIKEKDGKVGYRQIARIKLAQTYDIKESRRDLANPADRKIPFGLLDLEVDLNPLSYASLRVQNTLNVYSGDWTNANYDLLLNDGRGDAAIVGYHYARDLVEEIDLSLKAVLTNSFNVLYILRRNEQDSRTLESTYGIDYHRQCWGITLSYSESYDDRRFMLLISLTGLGRFGGS
ncbi:MAG: LPS-assembly protein LptD [Deltaproteobacteria bacterium]|nr:LPS-assembly protein LptD [Deltaproteobacteria bacterium]